MTNTPIQTSEQKPTSPVNPAPTPQQEQGTPKQPGNDKPSQPQQK
jgi:hypothetical protein